MMTMGFEERPGRERSGREYPLRPVVGVGAVVAVRSGDERLAQFPGALPGPVGVILIQRRFEPLAGEWSLPGGAVEVGETLQSAIAREVAEETGLIVQVGAVVDVFDRIMLDASRRVQYHFVLIDYLCRPVGGRLMPGSDVSEAIVADSSALGEYGLTEEALSVIGRALAISTG